MLLSFTHGWHGRWQLPINLSWCTLQNKSNKERKFKSVNHSPFAALSFKVQSIICWFVSVGMNFFSKSKASMLYQQYLNGMIVPVAIFFLSYFYTWWNVMVSLFFIKRSIETIVTIIVFFIWKAIVSMVPQVGMFKSCLKHACN